MDTDTPSTPGRRLRLVAAWVLLLNVVAAVVAVVANWPAQFGGVGTDARAELFSRGTAISAPVLPVVLLLVVVGLAPRGDRWGWLGIGAAYLTAAVVATGGIGEMVAAPTEDTPKAVLVGAGVGWLLVASALAWAATSAALARRSSTAGAPAVT